MSYLTSPTLSCLLELKRLAVTFTPPPTLPKTIACDPQLYCANEAYAFCGQWSFSALGDKIPDTDPVLNRGVDGLAMSYAMCWTHCPSAFNFQEEVHGMLQGFHGSMERGLYPGELKSEVPKQTELLARTMIDSGHWIVGKRAGLCKITQEA